MPKPAILPDTRLVARRGDFGESANKVGVTIGDQLHEAWSRHG